MLEIATFRRSESSRWVFPRFWFRGRFPRWTLSFCVVTLWYSDPSLVTSTPTNIDVVPQITALAGNVIECATLARKVALRLATDLNVDSSSDVRAQGMFGGAGVDSAGGKGSTSGYHGRPHLERVPQNSASFSFFKMSPCHHQCFSVRFRIVHTCMHRARRFEGHSAADRPLKRIFGFAYCLQKKNTEWNLGRIC